MRKGQKFLVSQFLLVVFSAWPVLGQELVFEETFNSPATIDENIWLEENPCAKGVVGQSEGANCLEDNCLRGNWFSDFTDPITGLTTDPTAQSRFAKIGVSELWDYDITDELFLDFWAFVDANADKEYDIKWIWLEGKFFEGEYNRNFNHIVRPIGDNWNTWDIVSNRNEPVGEDGGHGNRKVSLSSLSCIQGKLNGLSVDEWMVGRWHNFRMHTKLNVPASEANGIARFWIDGCLILDIDDYRYRDEDSDLFKRVAAPSMYGGMYAPSSSFGWQIDNFKFYNGLPDSLDDIEMPPDPPTNEEIGPDENGDSFSDDVQADDSSDPSLEATQGEVNGNGGRVSSTGCSSSMSSTFLLLGLVWALWGIRKLQLDFFSSTN